VRDDDGAAPDHELLERILHEPLALGVEGGGGFVEEEHARRLEHGARNGDALLLASAELRSALADFGGVRLREARHKGVRVGGHGRLLELLVRGVGLAVQEVLFDGAREENGFL